MHKSVSKKCTAIIAALGFMLSTLVPAQAAMVGAQQAQEWNQQQFRTELAGELQRADVRAELVSLGVNPADAEARLAALTDDEIAELQGKLDELPAGEGVLGLVGAVFVVLMILEFTGVIDIFKAQ